MKQTIYIDVLIGLNLFINYFIIMAVAKFMNLHINRYRFILASCLGAVYSLYILVPPIPTLLSIFIKLIMSLSIVVAAFKINNIKMAIKTFACFYLINFLFCGVIFAIWHFIAPKGTLVNNGIVYFNISPTIFLIFTVLSYLIIKLISLFVKRPESPKLFSYVEVELNNRKTIIRAKIDTGNSLREPFSHLPVMIVEKNDIEDILSESLKSFIDSQNQPLIYSKDLTKNKCRMIPFNVVSGSGMIPAFKADNFFILNNKEKISKEAYIAICPPKTFKSEFQAILNPELLEDR